MLSPSFHNLVCGVVIAAGLMLALIIQQGG